MPYISLFLKYISVAVHIWSSGGWGDDENTCVTMHAAEVRAHTYAQKEGASVFGVSWAINQCPGQPGREHFQTHLQQIMPAIPPSPRDIRASLMNHCPFRRAAEWSSPCRAYRVLLCLPAKTATKIRCKENSIKVSVCIKWCNPAKLV